MPNIGGIIKTLQNIMWKDPGVSGDAQRLEQLPETANRLDRFVGFELLVMAYLCISVSFYFF